MSGREEARRPLPGWAIQALRSGSAEDSLVHRALCHPNGEECPDGCDARPDPRALAIHLRRDEP